VNEVPEKGRDTTGKGRATDPCPEELPEGCSVPGPCTPESIDVWVRLRFDISDVLGGETPVFVFCGCCTNRRKTAPTRQNGQSLRKPGAGGARYVEVGGSGGYGWTGTCGSPGEPANDRRCGGGVESSPSTGWREVSSRMHAGGGQGHEQ
jgi:hypothetical protein